MKSHFTSTKTKKADMIHEEEFLSLTILQCNAELTNSGLGLVCICGGRPIRNHTSVLEISIPNELLDFVARIVLRYYLY